VRISGQDAIRGTFTHRHVGWTDNDSGVRYFPLQNLSDTQGRFDCFNSPLSEFGVLGFEFGYSLASPDTLLIWEAQFGDFANGAQVIIDQFLSSSEDKWNRISGLVMFLPHGYEGQGPEHSSARLERFLQLCAEDNMQVCNLTTPAQVFHALRRQIHRKWRKPLIVMTPKSLLRTRASFSPREELSSGGFQRLIDDKSIDDKAAKKVRRVMFCSGKIYYDLLAHREELGRKDVALVRLEQFHPFPSDAARAALARYSKATEALWVQEEPQNMGGWSFVRPFFEEVVGKLPLRYAGRAASASPATGSSESHKLEQQMIMQDAFKGLS
jgi:2-oxoglutarate dehydrogenase E1 component